MQILSIVSTVCCPLLFSVFLRLPFAYADPTIPGTIEEWLDEFEMFSIYQVLPEILELWGANLVTDIESKKTESQRPRNNDAAFPAPMSGDRAVHVGPRSPDHWHGP